MARRALRATVRRFTLGQSQRPLHPAPCQTRDLLREHGTRHEVAAPLGQVGSPHAFDPRASDFFFVAPQLQPSSGTSGDPARARPSPRGQGEERLHPAGRLPAVCPGPIAQPPCPAPQNDPPVGRALLPASPPGPRGRLQGLWPRPHAAREPRSAAFPQGLRRPERPYARPRSDEARAPRSSAAMSRVGRWARAEHVRRGFTSPCTPPPLHAALLQRPPDRVREDRNGSLLAVALGRKHVDRSAVDPLGCQKPLSDVDQRRAPARSHTRKDRCLARDGLPAVGVPCNLQRETMRSLSRAWAFHTSAVAPSPSRSSSSHRPMGGGANPCDSARCPVMP